MFYPHLSDEKTEHQASFVPHLRSMELVRKRVKNPSRSFDPGHMLFLVLCAEMGVYGKGLQVIAIAAQD